MQATAETAPVLGGGDAADDAAIWVHPTDPSLSLVITTDKAADFVDVHDLSGQRLQQLADPHSSVNNIDLRQNVLLGGRQVDLVVAGGTHLTVYQVDPQSRSLVNVTVGRARPVNGGHGTCMYHSRSGRLYAYALAGNGNVEQLELLDAGGGKVRVASVRGPWDVRPEPVTVHDGEIEACTADDRTGHVYIAEQDVGIWRYGAEPNDPVTSQDRSLVGGTAQYNQGAAAPDVEGLVIVRASGGAEYLLASSQGDDSFIVYRAQADGWALFRKFVVTTGSTVDGCTSTDGIDATATGLGSSFPKGMFVCQDHVNSAPGNEGTQNFKLVPLERILPIP